jgi:hypothetical protein
MELNEMSKIAPHRGGFMWKCMGAVSLLAVAMSAQNAPTTNKERHLDIPAISREANGSVVSIVMSDKDNHPIAQGSGFLISSDGKVVTNYHVIKSGASALVKLPDGAFFAVDGVLASDKNRDLAIIKAHGTDFRMLTLGDSNRLQIGEEVVAIGSPLSLESTVSNGIVSGIRSVEEEGGKLLQITAPISPGSSGGPLFNMVGQVVGITTSHLKDGENLNFAIPINDVKSLLTRLSKAQVLPDEAEIVASKQTESPSLAETLEWIKTSSNHFPGIEDHSATFDSYMYIFPEDSSCHDFGIFINSIDREGTKPIATNFIFTFDLGDVDPDSIAEEQSLIKFNVTDNQRRIRFRREVAADQDHLKAGQLTSKDDFPTAMATFFVGDDNYRSHLTKAFRHAVSLCGGKPSKF